MTGRQKRKKFAGVHVFRMEGAWRPKEWLWNPSCRWKHKSDSNYIKSELGQSSLPPINSFWGEGCWGGTGQHACWAQTTWHLHNCAGAHVSFPTVCWWSTCKQSSQQPTTCHTKFINCSVFGENHCCEFEDKLRLFRFPPFQILINTFTVSFCQYHSPSGRQSVQPKT